MNNIMKKIISMLIMVLCCVSSSVSAQSKVIKKLKARESTLKVDSANLSAAIATIENRSFTQASPEELLMQRLSEYESIEALAKDGELIRLLKGKYRHMKISHTYLIIINMYNSLQVNGGYMKSQNDQYVNNSENIRSQITQINPAHSQGFLDCFDSMISKIKDFRYAMFELKRVFALVDEKEETSTDRAKIKSSLKEDDETEIIDKIPFTKKLLSDYIDNPMRRSKILSHPSFGTIQ